MENSYQNSEFPNMRTENHTGVVADGLQVQPMAVVVGVTTADAKTTTNADRLVFVGVEEWPKTGLEHESSGEDLRKYVKNLDQNLVSTQKNINVRMLLLHGNVKNTPIYSKCKIFQSFYSPWQWCTPPTLLCTP